MQEKGITLKRGGWCRNGGCHFFITLQFNCIYCVLGKSKVSFIIFWFFSLLNQSCKILIQVFIVLKHFVICIFLIHSDGLQRMLTVLFKLVWNTQKSTCTIFFDKYQGKMFLIIENVLVSSCTALLLFSSHFWSKGVKFLLIYNLRNITKQNWH